MQLIFSILIGSLTVFALGVDPVKNKTSFVSPKALAMTKEAESCNAMCPFQICGRNFAIIADRFAPMTDEICLRLPEDAVRRIITTRRSMVKLAGASGFMPITSLTVNGFPPETFKSNFFTATPANGFRTDALSSVGYTGIVPRSAIEGLNGACVKLPIGRWQNDATGQIISRDRACVSFTTFVAKIEVRLSWLSNDDFDLSVEEPDGRVVFFGADAVGFLVLDQAVGQCGTTMPQGRTERVVYSVGSMPLAGTYTVQPRIFNDCDPSTPTPYTLQIVKDGNMIFETSGMANGPGVINDAVTSFNLP